MLHCIFTDPSTVITPLTLASLQVFDSYYMTLYFIAVIGTVYVCFAILQIFYPLAGYLADIQYRRKKCVVGSLCMELFCYNCTARIIWARSIRSLLPSL